MLVCVFGRHIKIYINRMRVICLLSALHPNCWSIQCLSSILYELHHYNAYSTTLYLLTDHLDCLSVYFGAKSLSLNKSITYINIMLLFDLCTILTLIKASFNTSSVIQYNTTKETFGNTHHQWYVYIQCESH